MATYVPSFVKSFGSKVYCMADGVLNRPQQRNRPSNTDPIIASVAIPILTRESQKAEKLIAVERPRVVEQPQLVHVWIIDGKEVSIFQIGNNLRYIVRDSTTKEGLIQGVVANDLNSAEMGKIKAQLLKCVVVLKKDGSPDFICNFKKWRIHNQIILNKFNQIRLIAYEDRLIWHYYDERTKTGITGSKLRFLQKDLGPKVSWSDLVAKKLASELQKVNEEEDFNNAHGIEKFLLRIESSLGADVKKPSQRQRRLDMVKKYYREKHAELALFESRHHEDSAEKINDLDPKKQVSLIEEYFLDGLSCGSTGIPDAVILTPKIIKNSHIDQRVLLSKFKWAVTLIRHGGIANNHAMLVVEGVADRNDFHLDRKTSQIINNGDYFMFLVHFDGKGGALKCLEKAADECKEDRVLGPVLAATTIISSRCIGGNNDPGSVEIINMSPKPETLRYTERSEVSKVDSVWAAEMLDVISKENNKELPTLKLNILGKYSIFSMPDEISCLDYCLGKLEFLGMSMPSYPSKYLANITKNYTQAKDYHQKYFPIGYNIV